MWSSAVQFKLVFFLVRLWDNCVLLKNPLMCIKFQAAIYTTGKIFGHTAIHCCCLSMPLKSRFEKKCSAAWTTRKVSKWKIRFSLFRVGRKQAECSKPLPLIKLGFREFAFVIDFTDIGPSIVNFFQKKRRQKIGKHTSLRRGISVNGFSITEQLDLKGIANNESNIQKCMKIGVSN